MPGRRQVSGRKQNLPSDSDNEGNLGLSLDEEGSLGLGVSLSLNKSVVGLGVLLEVLLSGGGGGLSSGSSGGLGLDSGVLEGLKQLGISGLLLQNVLGDDPGTARG